MKHKLSALFLIVGMIFCTASIAQVQSKVVAPLNAFAASLRTSKTPVYLPTYIPTWNFKMYGSTALGDFEYHEGYEATIATEPGQPIDSNTLFYMSGGKGPVSAPKGATECTLSPGHVAYYLGTGNFHTLDWSIGNSAYRIAAAQPQSELVKIANSMVAVK